MGPGEEWNAVLKKGLHIAEDIYYPEIIDSATGKTLGENQKGELVLTNLEKEKECR